MVPVTVLADEGEIDIPVGLSDASRFRRWAMGPTRAPAIPVVWFDGEVWADLSPTPSFIRHDAIAVAFARVLASCDPVEAPGRYLAAGALLTPPGGHLCCSPDGMLASPAGIRVRHSDRGRYVEVTGVPGMALEVSTASSFKKDSVRLADAYWRAGIPEYWLVDARTTPLRFDIYRHTAEGYVATRKRDGWLRSNVFGKSFQLVETTDRSGLQNYKLEVR